MAQPAPRVVIKCERGFTSLALDWADLKAYIERTHGLVAQWQLFLKGPQGDARLIWTSDQMATQYTIRDLQPTTDYVVQLAYKRNFGPRYGGKDLNDLFYVENAAAWGDVHTTTLGGAILPCPTGYKDGSLWTKCRKELLTLGNKEGAKVDGLNLLMFGAFGSGKSSLINTLCSAFSTEQFDGTRVPETPEIAIGTDGHVTTQVKRRRLPDALKHIKLWDIWGWSKDNYSMNELEFMLQGYLKDGFDQEEKATPASKNWNKMPDIRHRMHGALLVLSAAEIYGNKAALARVKFFQQIFKKNGFMPVVVLTKTDEIDSTLANDSKGLFESEKVRKCVQELTVQSGFPIGSIFPCKLYFAEQLRDRCVESGAMLAFHHCIARAMQYLNSLNNPDYDSDDEGAERKKSRGSRGSVSNGRKKPAKVESDDEGAEGDTNDDDRESSSLSAAMAHLSVKRGQDQGKAKAPAAKGPPGGAAPRFCVECGAGLPTKGKFCPGCGAGHAE